MSNRLANETSPYLQQHADNPVDWYPWGEEALAEAKRTGKPILLSVGYSACHWCHVMAHESFEDPAVAAVMNELYVNIKVDREERPDLDQVYQAAHDLLTQRRGGWPLTMFLTPGQLPFFGGTYFPPVAREGAPAFADLLRKVRGFYDEHREEAAANGREVAEALARTLPKAQERADLSLDVLDEAVAQLGEAFDAEHGGFGVPPKFPRPCSIDLLLRRHARTADGVALAMATHTLRRMAMGGLRDHVGGGFARYSTDASWTIPHFEKMLCDNGSLLRLYAEAWTATREPLFERACADTAGWAMREMQSPEGGYYSSLDADSEGEEGRFYVWQADEVRALLAPDEFAVAALAFGLDQPANFEGRAWHLALARPPDEVARIAGRPEGDVERLLDAARRTLLAARGQRVRPARDDKILTSWNALMVGGMARAARAFGKPEWLQSARRAIDFLRSTMWKDGRLLATYKDGRAHLDGYLDDHACLLAALLEALQAEFRREDLAWAHELGLALLERFHDPGAGGFHFTAHDHEVLIHRPKPGADGPTPSGNALAAWALHRLAFLTGEERFSAAAAGTVALFQAQVRERPQAFGTLLGALEEQLRPPRVVVVRGDREALAPWRAALGSAFLPDTLALAIPAGMAGLPAVLDKPGTARVNAWVCEGVTCLPPIGTLEELQETLGGPKMAGCTATTPTQRSQPA